MWNVADAVISRMWNVEERVNPLNQKQTDFAHFDLHCVWPSRKGLASAWSEINAYSEKFLNEKQPEFKKLKTNNA